MSSCLIAVDIGGTMLKVARFARSAGTLVCEEVVRVPSGLREVAPAAFFPTLVAAVRQASGGRSVAGVGVSTAGVVDYAGARVTAGMDYLAPMKSPDFREKLSREIGCPVALINDAEAALLGAAERGHVAGGGVTGLLVLGTGCGFALCRNGRFGRPDRRLPLPGAWRTPAGSWDELCGAVAPAEAAGGLIPLFKDAACTAILDTYLGRLAMLAGNLTLTHRIDTMLIGGGLADAARDANFDLGAALAARLPVATDFFTPPAVRLLAEGNQLALLGAAALAAAEGDAAPARYRKSFASLPTEAGAADAGLRLEKTSSEEIVRLAFAREDEAAARLHAQVGAVAHCAEKVAEAVRAGGRLLYVGCGTSGRVAAMDAVELNCTYGLPKDKSLAFISGGVDEATVSIEENFEEDASAAPDMILAQVGPGDVVVGVSASGSAYFVRSALAVAKARGAHTVLVSVARPDDADFFDHHIALGSGAELVTGSTRMTAGTATKKILNAISTAAMVRCGKVVGTHMIDLACLNAKLVERAQGILSKLYGLNSEASAKLLSEHGFRLADAVRALEAKAETRKP